MLSAPLAQIFLGDSQRRCMRRGGVVWMYHYLGQPARGTHDPYLYVAAERFRRQLAALAHSGYSTASLSVLTAACRAGQLMPDKVVISIDDGARNFFELGMQALAEYGFQAIQFLVAGQIGGINEWDAKHGHPVVPLMDAGQVREWLAEGHEIGSHSMTHRNLSKLSEPEARVQIIDSKKQLEDQFGVEVRHFCYPHGKCNGMTQGMVEEAGYQTGCTTRFGVNGPGQDPYALNRIAPLSAWELCGKVIHRLGRGMGIRV